MTHAAFQQQYTEALTEVAAVDDTPLPALEELMGAIQAVADGEDLCFPNFEEFFSWWDVATAYDQLDEEASAELHQPLLKVAYLALVAEGLLATSESGEA